MSSGPIKNPKNSKKGLQVKQQRLNRAPASAPFGTAVKTSINEGGNPERAKASGKGNKWAKKETKRKGINFSKPNAGGKNKKLRRAPSSQGPAV